MSNWPDQRITQLLGVAHPILLAPMAGAGGLALAVAVARAGGLGALPCAMLSAEQISQQVEAYRAATGGAPLNLNFFCHTPPQPDPGRAARWRAQLAPYHAELGLDTSAPVSTSSRAPFDGLMCGLVEALRPEVVSFHFGLPPEDLLARVKASGAKVLSSATTVAEARHLAHRGCDAIIAMGAEAGGHRAMFLSEDVATQMGTLALLPQVVDAVSVPVIAAGGIADARGILAAFALGAAAVQIGTAYLRSPEALTSASHRAALARSDGSDTVITNVFTGRPARGLVNRLVRELGPLNPSAPAFPEAGGALAHLRAHDAATGSADFTNLWAGQAAALSVDEPAEALTRRWAEEALKSPLFP